MPAFIERRDFINKRAKELTKFNILKQKVSGPFPQRIKSNSKEQFEIYSKYSKARKNTQKSIINQIERSKHKEQEFLITVNEPLPMSPPTQRLPKLMAERAESQTLNESLYASNQSVQNESDPQRRNSSVGLHHETPFMKESMQNMDKAIKSLSPLNRMTTDQIKRMEMVNRFKFANYEYKDDRYSTLPDIEEFFGVYTSRTKKEKPIWKSKPLDLSSVNKVVKDFSSKIKSDNILTLFAEREKFGLKTSKAAPITISKSRNELRNYKTIKSKFFRPGVLSPQSWKTLHNGKDGEVHKRPL
eukprot:CAMPEP_0197017106 /NCGR_PEP_ID=MMETSP1380-20130617/79354_1 /TAXON_ID=5936 /ORGANISM="Euplotes crassus, Strain CT5" /LENGTH=300 /DNA_ID=CAMNT_0042444163 /DNA_START=289 /DNA_END=1188 /DNA_ORIENTATION=-